MNVISESESDFHHSQDVVRYKKKAAHMVANAKDYTREQLEARAAGEANLEAWRAEGNG